MTDLRTLYFASCVSRLDVARQRLLASPCLQPGGCPLVTFWNAPSAAWAVNQLLDAPPQARWVVWVHQDVYLPEGWDAAFAQRLAEAQQHWPALAVAGVYGLRGQGEAAVRGGHVLDRGALLREPAPLPMPADSLDELLFAIRTDVPFRLDEALGFDFYATDAVLQAQAHGLQAAVVDAFCEHWSDTPARGPVAQTLVRRIAASADVFEHKWAQRLPVTTPCFHIARPGDTLAFMHWAQTQ